MPWSLEPLLGLGEDEDMLPRCKRSDSRIRTGPTLNKVAKYPHIHTVHTADGDGLVLLAAAALRSWEYSQSDPMIQFPVAMKYRHTLPPGSDMANG